MTLPVSGLHCLTLALLLVLGGCASSVKTDADGMHSVRCPDGGFSRCHDMAKRHCGRSGYRTLSEVSDTGSKSGGADDSLIAAQVAVRILNFACNP